MWGQQSGKKTDAVQHAASDTTLRSVAETKSAENAHSSSVLDGYVSGKIIYPRTELRSYQFVSKGWRIYRLILRGSKLSFYKTKNSPAFLAASSTTAFRSEKDAGGEEVAGSGKLEDRAGTTGQPPNDFTSMMFDLASATVIFEKQPDFSKLSIPALSTGNLEEALSKAPLVSFYQHSEVFIESDGQAGSTSSRSVLLVLFQNCLVTCESRPKGQTSEGQSSPGPVQKTSDAVWKIISIEPYHQLRLQQREPSNSDPSALQPVNAEHDVAGTKTFSLFSALRGMHSYFNDDEAAVDRWVKTFGQLRAQSLQMEAISMRDTAIAALSGAGTESSLVSLATGNSSISHATSTGLLSRPHEIRHSACESLPPAIDDKDTSQKAQLFLGIIGHPHIKLYTRDDKPDSLQLYPATLIISTLETNIPPIEYASIEALVHEIIFARHSTTPASESNDADLAALRRCFLLTFRMFTTPTNVLQQIRRICGLFFAFSSDESAEVADQLKEAAICKDAFRSRLSSLLYEWAENYYCDITVDIATGIISIIQDCMPNESEIYTNISNLISNVEKAANVEKDQFKNFSDMIQQYSNLIRPDVEQKSIAAKLKGSKKFELQFLDQVTPSWFAKQIAVFHTALLQSEKISQGRLTVENLMLRSLLPSTGSAPDSTVVKVFISGSQATPHFLTVLVWHSIFTLGSRLVPSKRAQYIEFWIAVADTLASLRDYTGWAAITCALVHPAVLRLSATWNYVRHKYLQLLANSRYLWGSINSLEYIGSNPAKTSVKLDFAERFRKHHSNLASFVKSCFEGKSSSGAGQHEHQSASNIYMMPFRSLVENALLLADKYTKQNQDSWTNEVPYSRCRMAYAIANEFIRPGIRKMLDSADLTRLNIHPEAFMQEFLYKSAIDYARNNSPITENIVLQDSFRVEPVLLGVYLPYHYSLGSVSPPRPELKFVESISVIRLFDMKNLGFGRANSIDLAAASASMLFVPELKGNTARLADKSLAASASLSNLASSTPLGSANKVARSMGSGLDHLDMSSDTTSGLIVGSEDYFVLPVSQIAPSTSRPPSKKAGPLTSLLSLSGPASGPGHQFTPLAGSKPACVAYGGKMHLRFFEDVHGKSKCTVPRNRSVYVSTATFDALVEALFWSKPQIPDTAGVCLPEGGLIREKFDTVSPEAYRVSFLCTFREFARSNALLESLQHHLVSPLGKTRENTHQFDQAFFRDRLEAFVMIVELWSRLFVVDFLDFPLLQSQILVWLQNTAFACTGGADTETIAPKASPITRLIAPTDLAWAQNVLLRLDAMLRSRFRLPCKISPVLGAAPDSDRTRADNSSRIDFLKDICAGDSNILGSDLAALYRGISDLEFHLFSRICYVEWQGFFEYLETMTSSPTAWIAKNCSVLPLGVSPQSEIPLLNQVFSHSVQRGDGRMHSPSSSQMRDAFDSDDVIITDPIHVLIEYISSQHSNTNTSVFQNLQGSPKLSSQMQLSEGILALIDLHERLRLWLLAEITSGSITSGVREGKMQAILDLAALCQVNSLQAMETLAGSSGLVVDPDADVDITRNGGNGRTTTYKTIPSLLLSAIVAAISSPESRAVSRSWNAIAAKKQAGTLDKLLKSLQTFSSSTTTFIGSASDDMQPVSPSHRFTPGIGWIIQCFLEIILGSTSAAASTTDLINFERRFLTTSLISFITRLQTKLPADDEPKTWLNESSASKAKSEANLSAKSRGSNLELSAASDSNFASLDRDILLLRRILEILFSSRLIRVDLINCQQASERDAGQKPKSKSGKLFAGIVAEQMEKNKRDLKDLERLERDVKDIQAKMLKKQHDQEKALKRILRNQHARTPKQRSAFLKFPSRDAAGADTETEALAADSRPVSDKAGRNSIKLVRRNTPTQPLTDKSINNGSAVASISVASLPKTSERRSDRQADRQVGKPFLVINLLHANCNVAYDYTKRDNVFRITTDEGGNYLLQAPDGANMQNWVKAISEAARTAAARRLTIFAEKIAVSRQYTAQQVRC